MHFVLHETYLPPVSAVHQLNTIIKLMQVKVSFPCKTVKVTLNSELYSLKVNISRNVLCFTVHSKLISCGGTLEVLKCISQPITKNRINGHALENQSFHQSQQLVHYCPPVEDICSTF